MWLGGDARAVGRLTIRAKAASSRCSEEPPCQGQRCSLWLALWFQAKSLMSQLAAARQSKQQREKRKEMAVQDFLSHTSSPCWDSHRGKMVLQENSQARRHHMGPCRLLVCSSEWLAFVCVVPPLTHGARCVSVQRSTIAIEKACQRIPPIRNSSRRRKRDFLSFLRRRTTSSASHGLWYAWALSSGTSWDSEAD